MSLSQKHTGKVFVPWFNTAEWNQVYNILYLQGEKSYAQALSILKVWKNRTPLLSAGVEGTLIILEALLTEKENLLEHQLTQIYAISIMRFLNLCATNSDKQGTFYKTAVKNELPKWLINIRHDIAHDHKLPSISILELGLHQCLGWIRVKYWQAQNEIICDYTVTESMRNPKVIEIFQIYVHLNLKLFSKNIDITEYDENVIKRINDIVFKGVTQPTTDISDIISILEEYLKENLRKTISNEDKEDVSKILIKALLSTEPETTSGGNRRITKDFRNVWSNLLNILNENNFISSIFNQLIDITNNIELENCTREIAALWISELFLGLQKVRLVEEELNNIIESNPGPLDNMTMFKVKSGLEEKYPQYEDSLEFYSTCNSCSILQDKMLKTPNNYTLHFLEKALRFNKNSENYIADMIDLVKKMVLSNGQGSNEEIFTIDNLENANAINSGSMEKTDSEETIVVDVKNTTGEEVSRWKLVKDTSVYKNCPLGVLPYQDRNKNPLLTV